MKTILVPTDFSKAALNATEYAISLANILHSNVLLLNVYTPPVMPYMDVPSVYPMPQELHQDAECRLENQVQNLKTPPDTQVSFKAVMGLPVNAIEEQAKNADFIVMGMREAGKLSELLIGSVATAVIKRVNIPVFLIPEKVTYKKPLKVALATDYRLRPNGEILEPLKQLSRTFDSQLFIVNIKTGQDGLEENIIAEAGVEEKFADTEHLSYFPENENLVEGINEFIRHKKVDLLAIIPHRYNWLEELFHRRNSKKIAFHSHVPLLALPEKKNS